MFNHLKKLFSTSSIHRICEKCKTNNWCNKCGKYLACIECNDNLFYKRCNQLNCKKYCGGTFNEYFNHVSRCGYSFGALKDNNKDTKKF
jgi:hypothetical protein